MWLITNRGLLSVVEDTGNPNLLLVRSRQQGLLEEFLAEARVDAVVFDDDSADYPHRVFLSRVEFAEVVYDQIVRIDYPNFKDSVKSRVLRGLYHRVWSVLAELGHGARYGLGRLNRVWWPDDIAGVDSLEAPPRSAFLEDGSLDPDYISTP